MIRRSMKLFVYVLFVVRPVLALKHSFHYNHGKGIIGPIGEPFGFNAGGQYQLNVSNFQLQMKAGSQENNMDIKHNAGFFLQRFDNDANFHKYMENLKSNNATTTICSFQYFLNDDDDELNDDHFEQHVEFGSSTNGVLLLMDSKKKWYTGNPSIHYRFKTYVLF